MYVGQEKIISKVKRTDVAYWAQKAIQEFSFDVLPSEKQIEVEVPPGLYTILPQDYVGYTKLSWTDHRGVERIVYRTDLTSNPTPYIQDEEYEYTFDSDSEIPLANDSTTLRRWNANNNSQSPMFGATGNWSWWLQNPDLMALVPALMRSDSTTTACASCHVLGVLVVVPPETSGLGRRSF